MSTTIYSYYINDRLFPCGESLDDKDIAVFIQKNNISEFFTDIPIYDSLEEYGISVGSKSTPKKNEYFNYIKLRKQVNARIK